MNGTETWKGHMTASQEAVPLHGQGCNDWLMMVQL